MSSLQYLLLATLAITTPVYPMGCFSCCTKKPAIDGTELAKPRKKLIREIYITIYNPTPEETLPYQYDAYKKNYYRIGREIALLSQEIIRFNMSLIGIIAAYAAEYPKVIEDSDSD